MNYRSVVPYNPYLSKKFNAHINVEVCSSVTAVKYLYKYVYKGHDKATIELNAETENDEIKKYLDSRYVSSSEAYRRINGFKMHDEYPKVTKLQVHLPNEQCVTFNNKQKPDEILKKNTDTTLTGIS
jgi:predicted O-linked N-acetylglucosamine transferase (SPINDLY family)